MWAAAIALVTKVLGIFFPDKSNEKVARDDGQTSGVAQQKAADQEAVIQDVQAAKAATDSVERGIFSGLPSTSNDGFRRD